MRSVSWDEGLKRLWLVASGAWLLFSGWMVYSSRWAYFPRELGIAERAGLPYSFTDNNLALAIMFGPPAATVLLWWGFAWVFEGFTAKKLPFSFRIVVGKHKTGGEKAPKE